MNFELPLLPILASRGLPGRLARAFSDSLSSILIHLNEKRFNDKLCNCFKLRLRADPRAHLHGDHFAQNDYYLHELPAPCLPIIESRRIGIRRSVMSSFPAVYLLHLKVGSRRRTLQFEVLVLNPKLCSAGP